MTFAYTNATFSYVSIELHSTSFYLFFLLISFTKKLYITFGLQIRH